MTKVQSADPAEWRLEVAASLLLLLLSASAQAQSCHQDNPLRSTGNAQSADRQRHVRRHWTRSRLLQWISRQLGLPNLVDYRDDPCLPVSSVG